jgi:hypothetical protein
MNIPRFTADVSLLHSSTSYRTSTPRLGQTFNAHTSVVPAIPSCSNCDWILERCARNNWRPRAVCNACAVGHCYSGVEDPTPNDPFTPVPGQW